MDLCNSPNLHELTLEIFQEYQLNRYTLAGLQGFSRTFKRLRAFYIDYGDVEYLKNKAAINI